MAKVESRRRIADCGLRIADCRRSRSSLLAPRSSRGISLTEVLIAMGIMTVGLLGVASLFPVGGYYMQKAEIADVGTAVAQSALADIVARGMLDPDTWRVYNYDGRVPTSRSGTTTAIDTLTSLTFLRQLGLALRQQLALLNSNTTLSMADKQWCLSTELGSAYVFDPIGVASATLPSNPANVYAYSFPASSYYVTADYYGHSAWAPWSDGSPPVNRWPIRRATFAQSNVTGGGAQQAGSVQLRSSYAGDLFSSHDDLALDLPDRDDLPARQNWEFVNIAGVQTPLARQWRGDYSWIVTVAPPTSEARDALAYGGRGYEYSVSVVVFYKRPISRIDPEVANPSEPPKGAKDAATVMQQQERTVRAKVVSTGLSGGELLLEHTLKTNGTPADYLSESPFDVLKVGEWVMLCGPHPASTDTNPRFVLQWYRVVAIDGKGETLGADGNPTTTPNQPERRLVTVRGPEWPWQPASDLSADTDVPENLSNWLCVGICPGAVAVHTRTMQLEGPSPWSVE